MNKARPTPEPIEVYMHLRSPYHALTLETLKSLSDIQAKDVHDAAHATPRSWGHNANDYAISRPQVL